MLCPLLILLLLLVVLSCCWCYWYCCNCCLFLWVLRHAPPTFATLKHWWMLLDAALVFPNAPPGAPGTSHSNIWGGGWGFAFLGGVRTGVCFFVEAPVLAWGELPSARTDCNSGGTFSKSPVDKYVSAITTHNKFFSFYHNDLISAEDTSIFVSGLTGGLGRLGSWSSRPFRRF